MGIRPCRQQRAKEGYEGATSTHYKMTTVNNNSKRKPWTGYIPSGFAILFLLFDSSNPLFTHVLFPVYLGILIWGGLYLRDKGLRTLVPLRRGNGG